MQRWDQAGMACILESEVAFRQKDCRHAYEGRMGLVSEIANLVKRVEVKTDLGEEAQASDAPFAKTPEKDGEH